MLILPYSTALTLAKPPVLTHATTLLLLLVFAAQTYAGITGAMLYYPDSWNPIRMVSASLAHKDMLHLFGNLLFFIAFAPALELLIGSRVRYLGFMLLISLVVGISYSISVAIGSSNLPTLGFSGVVMGVMGLSAYLMPQARIRVLWWYFIAAKVFYVPAWIVAAVFIGLDILTMLLADDYGGVNVVAHVSGGIAGYLYGFWRMQERREETRDELQQEVEAMKVEQKYGKTRSEAYRYKQRMDGVEKTKQAQQEKDRFLRNLYQMVTTHRDSQAILALLERHGPDTPAHELEELLDHIQAWGPSRTYLCLGRLIIDRLDREKRYGRAVMIIEKCQAISAQFILPDVRRTLFYAQMSFDLGKSNVTRALVIDAPQRYGRMVNAAQCHHLLQKVQDA